MTKIQRNANGLPAPAKVIIKAITAIFVAMWPTHLQAFELYLRLERSASPHTLTAYLHDVGLLRQYAESASLSWDQIDAAVLSSFVHELAAMGMASSSQARIVSGIRAFYQYLHMEQQIAHNPASLLEVPQLSKKLPSVLSIEEVQQLLDAIPMGTAEGQRNRAMLEVLYSCGLRVSELVGLRISQLYLEVGYIRVIGKGNKERLVPIGDSATKYISLYRQHIRSLMTPKAGEEDILFLSRSRARISRIMVFNIIKDTASRAGISKRVSPHTLRHCFATHLIEGGANLRAVQDMLGHASITSTEIYTHLDQAFLRETLMKYHPKF